MADATRHVAGGAFCQSKPEIFRTKDGKVIVEDELLNFIVKMTMLSHDEFLFCW